MTGFQVGDNLQKQGEAEGRRGKPQSQLLFACGLSALFMIDVCWCHTHDDDMGHALEGGLLDLADLVLVDAQLLQTLGHVGWHVLEHVLGQVEALQFGQRGEGLGVDDGDHVVHQDQGLKGRKGGQMHPHFVLGPAWAESISSSQACFGLSSCKVLFGT